MKHYDFNKAKELIAKNIADLESASLGMHEDWGWTSETIWKNGKYTPEFLQSIEDGDCYIAGINGSSWATPTLELIFKNGDEKMIECHNNGESNAGPGYFQLGVLSQPIQYNIVPLSKD